MKNAITGTASVIINASISKVWEALTDPRIIKEYFFGTDTHTDWKVRSPIRFTGEYNGKTYEDKGTILAFEPEKLIRYNYWSSMSGIEDKPENYGIITYKVSEEGTGTKVEIIQENIKDEKTKEHSEANWMMVLGNLKRLVEGSENIPAF